MSDKKDNKRADYVINRNNIQNIITEQLREKGVYPSIKYLSGATGLSEKTISRHITEIEFEMYYDSDFEKAHPFIRQALIKKCMSGSWQHIKLLYSLFIHEGNIEEKLKEEDITLKELISYFREGYSRQKEYNELSMDELIKEYERLEELKDVLEEE